MLGVRVGTWPELLEALRTICLLPPPQEAFGERLAEAAAGIADAFWHASHEVAPSETVAVLERELVLLC